MDPTSLRQFAALAPPDALKIVLVLFLSFLLGLEREGRRAHGGHYIFGGVRTFPLLGLLGYTMALLGGANPLPVALGLVVIASFLLVSYLHKLAGAEDAGVTTEISGLVAYLLGAVVFYGYYWVAATVVVLALLLLELKTALEGLSERLPAEEVITFTKFLLLTVVILPAVPNREFGVFQFNPFKTWLVVVAVSGISYGSYVLQRVTRKRGGIVLAALLGGVYSSTVVTVALARRGRRESRPNLFAGAMLLASGTMYLRMLALVAIFSRALAARLTAPFLLLAATAILGGLIWVRRPAPAPGVAEREYEAKNPLELRSAFVFAGIFVALLVVTRLVVEEFGTPGVLTLAALTGVTDVAPFVMGLTQTAGIGTPMGIAALAVVVATASNNLIKGVYAFAFADRPTGLRGLAALAGLALVGLLPLLVIAR